MALSPEQLKRFAAVEEVKDSIARRYLSRPGFTGVGVGLKEVDGRQTDELAVVFFVAKKGDVTADEMLPRVVGGVPTDVVELNLRTDLSSSAAASAESRAGRPEELETDRKKYDRLVGGINIAPSKYSDGFGTMGIMVEDADSDDAMMLSNYHVMASGGGAERGEDVCQPSRSSTITGWCSNCAEVERWSVGNVELGGKRYGIDAAVAKRTHREVSFGEIADIGRIGGVAFAGAGGLSTPVLKRGAESGRTEGNLSYVGTTIRWDFGPPFGTQELENQILIRGGFAVQGDSGSIVVKEDGLIAIGMIWSIDGGGYVVACQLPPVIEALDIIFKV